MNTQSSDPLNWVEQISLPPLSQRREVDHRDGYEFLEAVLQRAYSQAAHGKGAQRHAQGQPFEEQPMQSLIRLYGVGFALGQAAKKSQEAMRLPTTERQVAELLGAINYIAGAVIALERSQE